MKTKISLKYIVLQILIILSVLFACMGFAACDNGGLPEKLATPQNLRRVGNTLVWDEVEYADGYSLLVGNESTERLTKECACDLSDLGKAETYLVKLMAYSDRGAANSDDAEILFAGRALCYTKGMEFSLNSYGQLYVSKLAVDENGICEIPAIYRGYKVEYINTIEPKSAVAESTKAGSIKPSISARPVQAVCSQIEYLCLPYHMAKSASRSAQSFTNLKGIALGDSSDSEEPDRYVVEGNCIIDKKENAVVLGCIGSTISETVTKIGESAFAGRNIQSFTVPERIKEIGSFAFEGCRMLETLNLPENLCMDSFNIVAGCSSLKEVKIPYGVKRLVEAFSGCTSLTEVAIPESVTNLDCAFMNCTSLKTCVVPQSVFTLEGTFKGCTSLESVDISGVTELNTFSSALGIIPTFYKCTSLKEIKFGSCLNTIEEETFYGCTSLQSIELPDGVKVIGNSAFARCSSLKEISLPQSLIKIGKGAFSQCTALQSISIPDTVTSLGKDEYSSGTVFSGCTALKKVKLPNGVTYLADMFKGCTALESIEIPESVLTLINVFSGCTSLKSAVLPKQFKLISAGAFERCPLEAVYYNGSEAEWESVAANVKGSNELLSAVRYYYSETAPALNAEGTAYAGNFWRYENGVPTVWEYQA